MKSFKQYLADAEEVNEQAIARRGNLTADEPIEVISVRGLKTYYKFEFSFNVNGTSYDVYSKNGTNPIYFAIGNMIDDGFESFGTIYLKYTNYCNTNTYTVTRVGLENSKRTKGIATSLYKALVKHGYKLMGDREQYFGARILWQKLSYAPNYTVDLIDIRTCKVVEKDIKIKHGELDHDVDHRIWSYEHDVKDNLRLILKDIN